MIQSLDWDDLKFFLALFKARSLPGAAQVLGVSEATVSRRLLGLEERLGARLFDRKSTGHEPTEVGHAVEEIAQRISDDVDLFCRLVEGEDLRLQGSLVVTLPETLLSTWLQPKIEAFSRAYPQIALELRQTGTLLNLHQRAADVAIRATVEPPPGLVGRQTLRMAFATYATPEVAEDPDKRWVGWSNRDNEKAWKAGPFQDAPVHHRVSSAQAAFNMACAGLGIARLECYLGDPEPKLVRIDGAYFERGIWLLTHEGLRKTARVRAFLDFMYEAMATDKAVFEADATTYRGEDSSA